MLKRQLCFLPHVIDKLEQIQVQTRISFEKEKLIMLWLLHNLQDSCGVFNEQAEGTSLTICGAQRQPDGRKLLMDVR